MNKKLIALAVAAAIAPAAAMADSGNVTVYGIVDGSYDLVNPGYDTAKNDGTSSQSVKRVSSNSSRLGFKGTEDMGNGLSAVWQLETGFNVDGATAADLNSRNTFVGLSSKTAGTVILGKHDTPYKLATRGLDVFGDGIADNRSIMGGGGNGTAGGLWAQTKGKLGAAATTAADAYTYARATTAASAVASFDGRQNNVIAYISPTVNGLHGAIAYVAGGEDATTNGKVKGSAWSATGIYDNGPWFASLAYEKHSFGSNGTGNVAGPNGLGAISGTSFAGVDLKDRSEKAWKLGLGYKLDNLKLGFAYEKTSDDLGSLLGTGTSSVFGHNAYYLSAAYTMGSNVLKAAYTKAGDMDMGANSGAKQWTVGVDHNMSKRTKVYALYTKLNNDDNAAYTLSGGNASLATSAATVGSAPSAWSFGMRHSF